MQTRNAKPKQEAFRKLGRQAVSVATVAGPAALIGTGVFLAGSILAAPVAMPVAIIATGWALLEGIKNERPKRGKK